MTNHNYGYDINSIISNANSQENYQVESFALNLEDFLSNNKLTPESETLVDKTIEFLYGLVQQ